MEKDNLENRGGDPVHVSEILDGPGFLKNTGLTGREKIGSESVGCLSDDSEACLDPAGANPVDIEITDVRRRVKIFLPPHLVGLAVGGAGKLTKGRRLPNHDMNRARRILKKADPLPENLNPERVAYFDNAPLHLRDPAEIVIAEEEQDE